MDANTKIIILSIIQGIAIPSGSLYQTGVAQVTSGTVGNAAQATNAQSKVNIINNIINCLFFYLHIRTCYI